MGGKFTGARSYFNEAAAGRNGKVGEEVGYGGDLVIWTGRVVV
jgi:hypothetical protein